MSWLDSGRRISNDPAHGAVRMPNANIELELPRPLRLERAVDGLRIARLVLGVDHGIERALEAERALRRQSQQSQHPLIGLRISALDVPDEGCHRGGIEREAQPFLTVGQGRGRLAPHPGKLQVSAGDSGSGASLTTEAHIRERLTD